MKKYILRNARILAKTIGKAKQPGVALVITMMVMLTLVLISLSLVMQSNTEHLISQNEQDSFHALADAEWAVDFANRTIRTYVVTVRPSDLDGVLNGSVKPTGMANILGFKNNFDPTMNRLEIDNDNEETVSGIDTLASFPGLNWEVFRLGVDENNDNRYDGNIRTVVYARVFDNYDPVSADSNDTDLRVRVEVRTIYPVFVDLDDDASEDTTIATRGQSERHLVGRFSPVGSVAIRSDSDMNVHGSLELCGECGSAHANGTMTWEGPSACGSVTGTEGFLYDGGAILGDMGTQPEIYIPIVNPYNAIFRPDPAIFNTSIDGTLPDFLHCPAPTEFDPGSSKYFAIVKADNNTIYIYKAYRNYGDTGLGLEPPKDSRWIWRLIGNSDQANIDTIRLDNCGRVVTCGLTPGLCNADAWSLDSGSSWTPATEGVTGQNNTFYGWNPDNSLSTEVCPSGGEFETIPNTPYIASVDNSGSDQNDWNVNDFPHVNGVDARSNALKSVGGAGTAQPRSTSCGTYSSCLFTKPLPGVRAVELNAVSGLYETVDTGDNSADFDTSTIISNGDITATGNDIYSPLYNAVIFTYADVDFGGNVSRIFYYDTGTSNPAAQINIDDDPLFDLNATWRITVIGYGNVRAGGTVNINPPAGDPDYRWAVVAGRDLNLHGTADDLACNSTDCNGAPTGTQQNFAGAYLAHESIRFNGTVGVNGFVIAEDRATCSGDVDETEVFGSLDLHYDCENPSDIWSTESVRMRDWEESQRVQ